MITMNQVNAGEHQYSCRCGWIDNAHASMGDDDDDVRLDVVENWKQFPAGPRARRSPGNQGWLLDYQQPVGIMSRVAARTFDAHWFIRDQAGNQDAYRGAALALYQYGNNYLETLQLLGEVLRHSAFSYEDLSSNLIAWYRGVMGFSRSRVKEICQAVDRSQSVALAKAIDIENLTDKNIRWGKALLFNDRCETCKARGSSERGLVDMPSEFRTVKPGIVSFTPGVGDVWPIRLDALPPNNRYDKKHLPPWDRPPGYIPQPLISDLFDGMLGFGRRPGPAGKE